MRIFIDTAGFLAVLNAADHFHEPAQKAWSEILLSPATLFCSNYVLIETTALLQHRFGMDAVRLFQVEILPVLETVWIDAAIHHQALSAMLAANRRNLSLVDCTSFEIIRKLSLDGVFTFDPHFKEQGFSIIP